MVTDMKYTSSTKTILGRRTAASCGVKELMEIRFQSGWPIHREYPLGVIMQKRVASAFISPNGESLARLSTPEE